MPISIGTSPGQVVSTIPSTWIGMADDVMAMVDQLAAHNTPLVCFAGGGIYDHFLPPVVRSLTMRPEFVTSYTPYQRGEPGVLHALRVPVDGGVDHRGSPWPMRRCTTGYRGRGSGPHGGGGYRATGGLVVSRALAPDQPGGGHRGRRSVDRSGRAPADRWAHPLERTQTRAGGARGGSAPNYLGMVEAYDDMVGLAHPLGALAIASVNPMTLGLLRTPGSAGCDVAVAEGQPLGNPMSFGGPVVGLLPPPASMCAGCPDGSWARPST